MSGMLIITGGSRGLGKALINTYLEHNCKIISIARTETDFIKPGIIQIKADLSKSDQITHIMKEVFNLVKFEELSSITLINNAASLKPIKKLEDASGQEIIESTNLNLLTPMIMCSYFISKTKGFKGSKKIINISSGAAKTPYSGWSVYGTTKAGLDRLTQNIALEQKEDSSFKILSIYPGVIDTDMQSEIRSTSKKDFEQLERFIDLKENGALDSPENVATKIYKLAMNENIETGSIIDVRNF